MAHIIDERLLATPLPPLSHTQAALRIAATLVQRFGAGLEDLDVPGGWRVLYEPQLRLGPDVVVPDFAGWRRERMPGMPDGRGFMVAPDWAFEIVSPSTAVLVREQKMPLYARAGVQHLWIVDLDRPTLEVLRLENGAWTRTKRHRRGKAMRAEPFDTIPLDTRGWWPAH